MKSDKTKEYENNRNKKKLWQITNYKSLKHFYWLRDVTYEIQNNSADNSWSSNEDALYKAQYTIEAADVPPVAIRGRPTTVSATSATAYLGNYLFAYREQFQEIAIYY